MGPQLGVCKRLWSLSDSMGQALASKNSAEACHYPYQLLAGASGHGRQLPGAHLNASTELWQWHRSLHESMFQAPQGDAMIPIMWQDDIIWCA